MDDGLGKREISRRLNNTAIGWVALWLALVGSLGVGFLEGAQALAPSH